MQRLLLTILLTCVSEACLSEQVPDLTGVWMPVATTDRWPKELPYSDDGLAAVAVFQANYPGDTYDPGGFCVSLGMPRGMFPGGYWFEIIQRPERVTIIYERAEPPRRIFTDGRGHPDDIYPTKNGHSVGIWEDQTLVIETVGLVEREGPVPASHMQKIIERISLAGDDGQLLVNEITVHDSVIFTEPVAINVRYEKWPDDDLLDYECTEGQWRDYLRGLAEKRSASGN